MLTNLKRKNKNTPRLAFLLGGARSKIAMATLAILPASQASASLYWGAGGASAAWTTAGSWYTDAGETAVSGATPTIADDVIFSTTPDNAASATSTMGANIAAKSITYNTSGVSLLSQSGNRILSLGSGGITLNSGAGNATLGVSTNSLSVQVTTNQTWLNNSSSTLNVRTFRASDTAAGPVELTLNAASSGSIIFNLGANDSPDATKVLSVLVDSAGTGNVSMVGSSYTGGTTVKRGLLSSNGTLGTGGISLGVASGADDARINLTGIATNAITVQSGAGLRALTGSGSGDFQGNITLNKDLSIGSVSSSGQTIAVSGAISGNANLVIGRVATGTSNPTVTLGGASTYTGKTTVESATLVVSSLNRVSGGTASSNLGAPTTVANGRLTFGTVVGSILRYQGTGETTDRLIETDGSIGNFTVEQTGTGLLKFESGITSIGTSSSGRTLTLQGATEGTGEIVGVINDVDGSGSTGLTKAQSGTWRLSNVANTYAGATNLTGGVLEAVKLANGGVASSIGMSSSASSGLVFGGTGGTLRYIGTGDSTNRTFTTGANGGTIDASGSGALVFTGSVAPSYGSSNVPITLTLTGSNAAENTYSANHGNNGTGANLIVKNGSGTWVLAGTTVYTGGTTINDGVLKVTGSLANTGPVTVAGGTYTVAASDTVGAVTLATGTINGAGTLTGTSYAVSSGTVAAALGGTAGLTKSTAGTVVLSGSNSYNGATSITGGTLIVGNGISGSLGATAVTVDAPATLAGSGSIAGAVTVNGILAPGNSPGILSTGDLTLAVDSDYVVELNGTTAGTQHDQTNVTGTVSIAGDLLPTLGYAPTLGDKLFIVRNDDVDAVSGTFAGLLNGNTVDLVYASQTYRFAISYFGDVTSVSDTGGNDVVLMNVAIPEPATLSLLAMGLAGLARRRRA